MIVPMDDLADERGAMRLLGAIIRQAAFDCANHYRERAGEQSAQGFLDTIGILHRVDEIVTIMSEARGRAGGLATARKAA